MAYTKEEHENLLREIAETGGDTPTMLELLQKLRDDFDDREGMLRKYGEEKDRKDPVGEQQEDEKIRNESKEDNAEDNGMRRDPMETVPKADYEELRRQYIERFFGGEPTKEERPREKTIDDLFRRKE